MAHTSMMLSVGVEDVSAEDFSPRAEGSEVSTGMDAVRMRVGVNVGVEGDGCTFEHIIDGLLLGGDLGVVLLLAKRDKVVLNGHALVDLEVSSVAPHNVSS